MESGLRLAESTRTPQQELLPILDTSAEIAAATVLHQEDDTAASVYDAPPLPRSGDKFKYLLDPSESEKTGDKESLTHCPLLHSDIPRGSESGTEVGDEFGFEPFPLDRAAPSTSAVQRYDINMHELSGRSRALLKESFEKT